MKILKRVVLLLLTLALMLSMVPAAVADVGEEDIYVLQRALDGAEPNLAYASPYSFDYKYVITKDNIMAGWKTVDMFSMHNTLNKRELIPTYCLDMTVEAKSGTLYHRLNLEDSSYAASVAGRIRAIMLKGFYIENPGQYASDEAHQEAINDKISDISTDANNAGFTVTNLTMGEAMSATQLAIWEVIHGDNLSFPNFARTSLNYSMGGVRYGTLCKEELFKEFDYWGRKQYHKTLATEMGAKVKSNIEVFYNYLLSLEPVAATSKVVSPSSFIDLNDPVFTENEDGTYDVSVTVSVDVEIFKGSDQKPADQLTLKMDLVGYEEPSIVSADLVNGTQTVTLTIGDVPAEYINGEVTLAISGYQTGNGVFMFDAIGGRETSQTMVAMDSSQLPVYAEVVAQKDRVLNFHKISNTRPAEALEGIIFDIYPVKNYTLEDYITNPNGLPAPSEQDTSGMATYSVITDKNGNASLNFTQYGLEDGIYVVVERYHPKTTGPIAPFYIIFPASFMQSSTDDYTITVEAKNELVDAPVLTGGITIKKVDAKDETVVLEGATFEVYRPATPEELAANEGSLSQIPGVTEKVVPVSFYLDEAMTEAKTEATTDANGTLSIYGLPYGKYYLLETQAPAGYNLPAKAVEITINGESVENSFVVKNVSGAILPETGGMGTGAFTFGGVVLVAFSILMLLDRKRKAIN